MPAFGCLARSAASVLRRAGHRAELEPRAVDRVGVLGAGTMGPGSPSASPPQDSSVTLVDTDARALAAGMERVRSTLSAAVDKGRLDAASAAAAIGAHRQRRGARSAAGRGSGDRGGFRESRGKAGGVRIARDGFAVRARCSPPIPRPSMSMQSPPPRGVPPMWSACTSSVRPTSCAWSRSCAADPPRPRCIATAQSVTRRMGKIGRGGRQLFRFRRQPHAVRVWP